MEILVLDYDFTVICVVDFFKSLIWTDRYYKYGDFELVVPIDLSALDNLTLGRYLKYEGSEHIMCIEVVEPVTDAEEGNTLRITGRSLETILERRIVWTQTTVTGSLQNGIKKLINDAIISPVMPERAISNFIFEDSSDPAITDLTLDAQYTGDEIYSIVQTVCETCNIGFKITLTDNNKLKFSLYSGADRTYAQYENPYVIFSPSFENLVSSRYFASLVNLKNVTLVAGEGEGLERKTYVVGEGSGINRRELYTDARDLSSDSEEVPLTTEEYNLLLEQRGTEKLSENTYVESFEGQVEPLQMFTYGKDFFIGDTVQIENEYGIEGTVCITEFIMSQNEGGLEFYPTFTNNQQREEI